MEHSASAVDEQKIFDAVGSSLATAKDARRHFLALPTGMTVFRNRLKRVFHAFLAMAGALSSADCPGFSRTRIVTPSGRTPNSPGKSIDGSKRTIAGCYSASNSCRAGDRNAGTLKPLREEGACPL